MIDHKGHVLTNRFSGDYCDTCDRSIEHDPTRCDKCNGAGICHRWTNAYHGKGKAYSCGKCKGTGVAKPTNCHDCQNPAGIRNGKYTENLPVAYCANCYEARLNHDKTN
jgi:DnaJ-class molecular chaperone